MPEQSLYELIHQFRGWLAKKGDCGKLISERILLSSGELVGMQFCCETAAIQWEFASSQAEVVPDSGNARKIELDFLAAAEPRPPLQRLAVQGDGKGGEGEAESEDDVQPDEGTR